RRRPAPHRRARAARPGHHGRHRRDGPRPLPCPATVGAVDPLAPRPAPPRRAPGRAAVRMDLRLRDRQPGGGPGDQHPGHPGLRLTAIVAAFAVGLPGFSVYLFTLRAFYALKDTRTPFYLNTIENVINVVTAVFFVHWWGIVGLALSFALSYTVAAWLAFAV